MTIPWVHSYDELRAIGVNVTEQQRFTVENGGQVLMVRRLPALTDCGCGEDHGLVYTDESGNPVMVPATFTAANPLEPYGPTWRKRENISIAQHFEDNMGDHWRLFPSYVGVGDATVFEWIFEEELYPLRAWTGLPLLSEPEQALARTLVGGFADWLARSAYSTMQEFMWMEAGLNQGWSDWDPEDEEDEETQRYWETFHRLVADGYLLDLTGDSGFDWRLGRPIDFPPIESCVPAEALALWRRVLYQSEHGAVAVFNAVAPAKRDSFAFHEREIDPWL